MNALIEKQNGNFIGQCGLLIQKIDGREELEIGYAIMPKFHRQGFASEAAIKCRDHAFENNFTDSIISVIHPDNFKSTAVARKNGMKIEKQSLYNDAIVNIFRITRMEWEKLKT